MVNYDKISQLPALVRSFCFNNDGWIVGSGAAFLLDLAEEPRDWDVLIPFWSWGTACLTIPKGTPSNSFGGMKLDAGGVSIDVWAGDVGWFLAQVPKYPAYGVHPKSMVHLVASNAVRR